MEEVVSEDQIDELFRDYYRYRDNSMLQLLLLLFSKTKVAADEKVPDMENKTDTDFNKNHDNAMFK